MAWTAKPQFSNENKSGQRGMARKGAVYPWLPAIIDEETLAEITTFESGERAFVSQQGRQRRQYLSGLYLKAATVLGHFHFQPRELPLQFRRKMGSRLGCDQKLTRILTINKAEKKKPGCYSCPSLSRLRQSQGRCSGQSGDMAGKPYRQKRDRDSDGGQRRRPLSA